MSKQLNNLKAADALIAFGADIYAMNYYQQSPLDLARNNNHEEMLQRLFSLGAELGDKISQRFEQFVTLPRAPIKKQNETKEQDDNVLNWRDLSLENNKGFSRSLSTEAEESYTAWLEWRKRRKVRLTEKEKKG